MTMKLIKDWMSSPVITVSSSATLPDAYWLILDNNIRRLLVHEGNGLVGIITESDIFRAFVEFKERH